LLAYTLRALYDQGGADRLLTLDEYRTLGGVQGAIAAKLQLVLTDPEPTAQEARALQRAFTRYLIRVDEDAVEGERLLRRVVSRALLPQSANRVISRLVDAGLLLTKDGTIEVAHERLIDDWPTLPLKTWLIQDATDRRLIDQLRQRVDDGILADGLLSQAEELVQRDLEFAIEEPALAKLLQRARRQKRALERRRSILFSGALIVALVLALLAGIAWWQKNEAENRKHAAEVASAEARRQEEIANKNAALAINEAAVAESRRLAAESSSVLKKYPQRSLLLAVEAVKVKQHSSIRVAAAEQSLREALCVIGGRLAARADGPIVFLAISADSRWVVTGSSNGASQVWDLSVADPAANPVLLQRDYDWTTVSAVSADSRWVVTSENDKARLWDLREKDPAANPRVLQGHGGVTAVAISADSHWVVTGSRDNTARLWDLRAKDPAADPRVLQGHDGGVTAVAISPDSRWVVTGSDDKTARLWDLSTKNPAANPVVLRGHEEWLTAAAISADSRWVVTGSEDNTARLWLLQLKDLVDLARTIVGRNFFADEWQLYFPGEKYRKTFPDLPGPD
jgi:hypothetical protein